MVTIGKLLIALIVTLLVNSKDAHKSVEAFEDQTALQVSRIINPDNIHKKESKWK